MRAAIDVTTQRHAQFYSIFDGFFVQARQSAGMRQADHAGMRIGRAAKSSRIRTKGFARSAELNVCFEAYDGFVCQGVECLGFLCFCVFVF
jgi:hypothetical protein